MATKSAISFGLVHIPISLHTATRDNDISFNQLHKTDHSRIRYKKTCGHCGNEVKTEDVVKGYEYDDGQYVVVTDEDFEKIKTEKDKAIHILHFATLSEISPVFYDKTYHAVPEAGGDKAFELLRTAMIRERKIAIAKTVLGTKETLLDEDFVVCGYFYKEGFVASIILGAYRKDRLVYQSHVAMGVSRRDFELISSQRHLDKAVYVDFPDYDEAIWIEPALVCKVQFMERTPGGGLRQPVFHGLRDDKTPTECVVAE